VNCSRRFIQACPHRIPSHILPRPLLQAPRAPRRRLRATSLTAAALRRPAQVLMDGFMPIKTGWDATKEIREREAAAGGAAGGGLIIIGVTGATTSEDARKCLDCGMTDFIPKVDTPPPPPSPRSTSSVPHHQPVY
jgi:CheY-like chemotaxis protein